MPHSSTAARHGTRRWLAGLTLGGIAVLAFAIRFVCEPELREGSPRRFVSPDCLYHMRRATFAVAHFPRIPLFDPLIDYPNGAVGIWPPLFDVALAIPARLLDGVNASREQIAAGASIVPPILGALAVLAVAFFAKAIRARAAPPVALFVALCGAHIQYSQYGHTDQHVAESLTSLLALGFFLRARDRPNVGRELLAGFFLGIAALTWQGAICWGALVALTLAIDAARRPPGEAFRAAVIVLGGAAIVDGAGVAFWTRGDPAPFTFVSFGAFQPVFLAAMAAGVIVVEGLVALARRERRRAVWTRVIALVTFAAILRGRIPELVANLRNGVGYITKTSYASASSGGLTSFPREMLLQIYEARPLLADGWRLAFDTLSAAFFLVPVALAIWIVRAVRGPRRSLHLALAVWGALVLWLALSQRLNVYYAAPLAGLAGWEIVRQLAVRSSRAWARHDRKRTAVRAQIALGSVLLLTVGPGLRRQLETRYAPGDDLIATMEWARIHLPHPVSAYDSRFLPPRRPVPELSRAEGMLSPWALGHFVTFYAELPAPADAFGYGFFDSIRFFLSESEDDALAIARRRRTRWIAVTDLTPKMNDYGKILGRPPYLVLRDGTPKATDAYFRTMQSRLYDFDGAGPAPLLHFRLVHASRTGTLRAGRFVARWKIFEID